MYDGYRLVNPQCVHFSVFTAAEVRQLSVLQVTSHLTFDALGHPVKGGLYDEAMGPMNDRGGPCATCHKSFVSCPGHVGHVELPVTVVNPLFHTTLHTLLSRACFACHRLQISLDARRLLDAKLRLLRDGRIADALDLVAVPEETPFKLPIPSLQPPMHKNLHKICERFMADALRGPKNKACLFCKQSLLKIVKLNNKLMHTVLLTENGKLVKKNASLMPDVCRDHLRKMWENDSELLRNLVPVLESVRCRPPVDSFFLDAVVVPPPIVRPANKLKDQLLEHPQSQLFKAILKTCFLIRTIVLVLRESDGEPGDGAHISEDTKSILEGVRGTGYLEKLHNAWQDLQATVDALMISEKPASDEISLKQIIEKKTGIIRSHMMGKRVNYAARSVITPDPNIDVGEIGIPEQIAVKLTYPVYVTPWNVEHLRKLVINGPTVHPGATLIENEDGKAVTVPFWSKKKREALAMRLLTPDERETAGMKIVHRHLINGDVLLLNRQPTLHKPSIMAHRVRVLKGEKTLRLHYANCKAYNADFDGDEMNAHFPQNEIARSEAVNIMNVENQYLVPKDGTPLSGLIQDHVISGVRLTLRGTFFNKTDYQQLVFQGLSHLCKPIKLLPPSILKPYCLWSGKQVLSTLIINIAPDNKTPISLISTSKINARMWQTEPKRPWQGGGTTFFNESNMSESEVLIRNGELLCGILDKSHFGATPYSLVHCFYELYGGNYSSMLLSSFAKLFTYYLQWRGFTLGVKDIIVVPNADEIRSKIIKDCRNIGDATASDALDLEESNSEISLAIETALCKDPKFKATLDRKYKAALDKFTNNINKACLPSGLLSQFPENNLQLMVQSGAKGSTVNTMQISCLLGQIELEGKRPPIMMSGRSLPSFPPYDTSPRAGGFIDGRFMTGIQPQEFFFHCMAGREGLIDTAVKTSKSGYLQRCLIKHLEGIKIAYDMTVRDSDNSVIQFAYGEDGMDVCKAQYLNEKQFKFLDLNTKAIINKQNIDTLKEYSHTNEIESHKKSIKRWMKKKDTQPTILTPFHSFVTEETHNIDLSSCRKIYDGRDRLASSLTESWFSADPELKKYYIKKCYQKCPDPVVSRFSPDSNFGAINERLSNLVEKYLKSRHELAKDGYTFTSSKSDFSEMIFMKSMESLAVPGEPVGLLAAQSIGEPSTQMTLNTFHFAGRGDMNVTLGIPRLREILMLASRNLKTPTMDIPLRSEVSNFTKKAENLQKKFSKVTVFDVLHQIKVKSELRVVPEKVLMYTLEFQFLPKNTYKDKFNVTPQQIVLHMENNFFKLMFNKIAKASGKKTKIMVDTKTEHTSQKNNDDDDDAVIDNKAEKNNDKAESSDEELGNDDDDNTEVRLRKRRNECQEYDDPESEEEEHSDEENALNDDNKELEDEGFEEEDVKPDQRTLKVVDKFKEVKNYTYDKEKFKWCKVTFNLPVNSIKIDLKSILRNVAEKSVIKEIPNIKRAIIYTNNNNEYILKTEGINITETFKYDNLLKLDKLYSNDVHAIALTYGIEAACKVIIREVQNVFGVYGIKVDFRHLSLIADYMTYNGVFEPMSRKGMESSASPLQQMSFESSLTFLKEATLKGKSDHLTSTSSCLMVGQPCKSGTGSFVLRNAYESDYNL